MRVTPRSRVGVACAGLSDPTASSLAQNSDIQIKTPPVPSTPTYSFTLTEKHTK